MTPTTILLPAFGAIEPPRVFAIDDLFAVIQDKFPVSPGHTLIIARRAVIRYHELTTAEKDWSAGPCKQRGGDGEVVTFINAD